MSVTSARLPETAAVVGTVTVTDAAGTGYVTLWGAGATPFVSNVNITAGGTASNHFIAPLSSSTINQFNSVAAHLIIDISGYYLA